MSGDPTSIFIAAMASVGIRTADKITGDGKLHRIYMEGDRKGTKNGFYTLHLDPPESGAFGSWKHGVNETWTVDKPERMSPQDRAKLQERMAATRREREAEIAESHAACREAAALIMAATEPAKQDHPYLVRKNLNVTPGLKQLARDVKYTVNDPEKPNRTARKGSLVIPIYGPDRTLHSVQTIDGTGRKHFLFGTNKKGHYWSLGKLTPRIVIGEGYSTCATVHGATGCCTVIAFDSGNLKAVALAIRAKYPEAEIVMAADNDRFTTKPVPNPGMTKACEAAAEVGGLVAWPEFDDGELLDGDEVPTDFNDLAAIRRNRESVAAAFAVAVAPHDIENHVDPRRDVVERPDATSSKIVCFGMQV
uniref:Toprim domain-containing protein n=1 Tax=Bosea sp. NBC_00436 TaxID=2969620 RepID=A0A9E7ZZJ9_9HYPH